MLIGDKETMKRQDDKQSQPTLVLTSLIKNGHTTIHIYELCSEAIFGNLGVSKNSNLGVTKNGNFAQQVLPVLAIFIHCQVFFLILAIHKVCQNWHKLPFLATLGTMTDVP